MAVSLRFPHLALRLLIFAPACFALLFAFHPVRAQDSTPGGADDGNVSIGGQVVMRLRSASGGLSVADRVDAIEDRLTDVISVPDIKTSSVVVYAPAGHAPVIYVLGRRLITVDAATVKSAGGGDAKQLAIQWAKRLQQILPRVDIRLPNEPEPVVPAHPPLLVTSDLSQVGGNVGYVVFRNKSVMRLVGVQPGGLTAVERAVMLSRRLNRLSDGLDTSAPDAVFVQSGNRDAPADQSTVHMAASTKELGDNKGGANAQDGAATIVMGGKPVFTVTEADCKAGGFQGTPTELANAWVKNIRLAMGLPATPAAPAVATGPVTPTAPTAAAPASPTTPPATETPANPPAPPTGTAPANPGPPAAPNAPANPPSPPSTGAPANPSTPAQPSVPASPSTPATPSSPAAPNPGGPNQPAGSIPPATDSGSSN